MASPAPPSQNPSTSQSLNPILDRSQSAPAAMDQTPEPGQCPARPGFTELHTPLALAKDEVPTTLQSNSKAPPLPSSSTDVLQTCTPPAEVTTMSQDASGEAHPGVTEEASESGEAVNSSEEVSSIQPMEQEATDPDGADTTAPCQSAPGQPSSVGMESPAIVSSERDQPDGDRCSSSDSIPSLAAALMELHELLVSNNHTQSQNRSSSSSPSLPFNQDTERVSPEPGPPTPDEARPTPSTAITAVAEDSDAKANRAAATVWDEEPSECCAPNLSTQEEVLGGDAAENGASTGPPQCPEGPMDTRPEKCGQGHASDVSTSQSEPEAPTAPAVDLQAREPPEGQHSRGVADGQASGSNSEDYLQTEHIFLRPASVTAGSPEDVPSTLSSSLSQAPQPSSPAPPPPPTHPFTEQFPAEHIQRIQAAGFSAREAVEALERAHGVVELALLALLARSITVPT